MSVATVDLVAVGRQPLRILLFFIGCALAVALFIWLVLSENSAPTISRAAPAFALGDVNGAANVSLAQRSGKPAVVNFFASWCIPCRSELPRLAQAARTNPNISFFGVDHQDSRSQAHDLLTASGVTYPSGYDPNGSVAADYRITTGLPATVFIGRDGKIVRTVYGEVSADELNTELSRLAGEK